MRKKRIAALAMAVSMLTAALGGAAGALQGTDPSADEYVSLHQYTSRTDDPSVYKITQTVQVNLEKPAVFITFMLDDSTSMTRSDIFDANSGMFISRYAAVRHPLTQP